MNQQERHQLHEIIEEIEGIRQHAPFTSTYSQGRVQANVGIQLMSVLEKLKEMVGDATTEKEPTE